MVVRCSKTSCIERIHCGVCAPSVTQRSARSAMSSSISSNAVVAVKPQRRPTRERIVQCTASGGLRRGLSSDVEHGGFQIGKRRSGPALSCFASLLVRASPDLGFHGVERSDALGQIGMHRCTGNLVQIVELASDRGLATQPLEFGERRRGDGS